MVAVADFDALRAAPKRIVIGDHGAVSSRVAEVVERAIAAGEYAGAAVGVAIDGRIVVEHYAGEAAPGKPSAPESIWPLASISKCFTAAMVMCLVERGDLSLETRVHDLLPRFRGDDREEIRVRHLLGHTSGLRYESPRLEELLLANSPLAAILEEAITAPPLFPAGVRFTYSDDAYLLAGYLAEVVTGDRYADLVQSLVIDAMGLGATWVVPPRAVHDRVARVRGVLAEGTDGAMYNSAYGLSLAHPAFGVVSSLRDMLRFAAHFAPGGPRIHRDATVSLLTTPQADLRGHHPLWPELGDDVEIGWGLTFEVQTGALPVTLSRHAAPGAFGHPGASGCRVVVDPATRTIAVVLTNTHLRTGLVAWRTRLDVLADAAFEDAGAPR
jgi:CubicO group peptidase (beta-lactamase class C family)